MLVSNSEHTGSNFIVRPVSSSGASTIIENTGGGALGYQPKRRNVGIGTTSPWAKLSIAEALPPHHSALFRELVHADRHHDCLPHHSQGMWGLGRRVLPSRLHIVGDGTTTIRLGSSLATGDV